MKKANIVLLRFTFNQLQKIKNRLQNDFWRLQGKDRLRGDGFESVYTVGHWCTACLPLSVTFKIVWHWSKRFMVNLFSRFNLLIF
jgi:hypothetical protein